MILSSPRRTAVPIRVTMLHRLLLTPLFCLLTLSACGQPGNKDGSGNLQRGLKPARARDQWADSVYNALSPDERIGQLFMVAAYSGGKNANEGTVMSMVRKGQIGGVIFMQGGPVRQALMNNRLQDAARVPLLVAMDAEWGLGMRLDSVQNLPRQMMIGATRDTGLAYAVGRCIAYQCKRLGVHVNFGPDVDVNNNPDNPVINTRSFGESKQWVSVLGLAYMHGLQDNGVMACAKHFPGHGDVSVDSHKDLPVIGKSRAALDTLELYPFRELIKGGVQSVMVAHLSVPALEPSRNVPTTLSPNTITGLLRRELGFQGLIFTDALNMQGVAKYYPAGEADYRAYLAGNDVLLFSQDVAGAIGKIKAGLQRGEVNDADLELRVKKILAAKYDAGLNRKSRVNTTGLTKDLNQYTAALNQQIANAAVTLVRDDAALLSRLQKPNPRVAYIAVNGALSTSATALLRKAYPSVAFATVTKSSPDAGVLNRFKDYDVIIIGLHGLSLNPGNNYGLAPELRNFLTKASAQSNVAVALMGNAYATKMFCNVHTILVGYEDNAATQQAMVLALSGQNKINGRLPVTPPCLK